jgi:hypothetical protein
LICGSGFFTLIWDRERLILREWDREWDQECEQHNFWELTFCVFYINLGYKHNSFAKEPMSNEEYSPTFDRRVSPLVGAATPESNVWVLSVKGRKKEKQIAYHLV